jgi:hypothetical protein
MLPRSSAASKSCCAASGFAPPPAAVPVSAPETARDRFRPSLSALAPPWRASASLTRIEVCCPTPVFHVWAFSHSRNLLCPLLTSDRSSLHLSMPVAQGQTVRPPRVLRTHLRAYLCRIYAAAFRASIGLYRYAPAHPAAPPLSAELFVRPALCLQLPSDSTSRWTPLPFG